MGRFILRRLGIAIPVILGVTIVNYVLINLTPGDPVDALVDPSGGAEAREAKRIDLGLDQPVHVRYVLWLGETAKGNLGYSYLLDRRAVAEKIGERLGPTALLAGTSLLFAFIAGIALGVISALRPYSRTDFFATLVGILGVSVPSFFFGLVVIYLFSLKLPVFPSAGMLSTGAPLTIPDLAVHLVLPVVALGLGEMASIVRYTRSSMLEVLEQDYIRTAQAKGLTPRSVAVVHALRNALNPVITQLGIAFPRLLGGAVVIESVFGWPGVGRLTIEAILQRDYPVIMGLNLMIAVLVILGGLVADVLYAVADPRIAYD